MSRTLLLIMNPYSGMKVGRRYLADILERFCQEDYIPTVFMTSGQRAGAGTAIRPLP